MPQKARERLREILEGMKRKTHFYNDDDCYYSCPKHPEYCGDLKDCNCGFESHNAKVEEALELLKKWRIG